MARIFERPLLSSMSIECAHPGRNLRQTMKVSHDSYDIGGLCKMLDEENKVNGREEGKWVRSEGRV